MPNIEREIVRFSESFVENSDDPLILQCAKCVTVFDQNIWIGNAAVRGTYLDKRQICDERVTFGDFLEDGFSHRGAAGDTLRVLVNLDLPAYRLPNLKIGVQLPGSVVQSFTYQVLSEIFRTVTLNRAGFGGGSNS